MSKRPSDTARFVSLGEQHDIRRDQVEAAASRLVPAHSGAFGPNREWYALVGTGLYYVRDLVSEATGHAPSDVRTARMALAGLGFPVLCWAWGDLLENGHPMHVGG
ncbi:hypothetical protein [Streptomyces sp. CAU 1734]|uniref:hypothetical protein n=1 Tax=Streptomyces sp. CAU 1734 TaxID=3140360 RepID=UPI003260CA3E